MGSKGSTREVQPQATVTEVESREAIDNKVRRNPNSDSETGASSGSSLMSRGGRRGAGGGGGSPRRRASNVPSGQSSGVY